MVKKILVLFLSCFLAFTLTPSCVKPEPEPDPVEHPDEPDNPDNPDEPDNPDLPEEEEFKPVYDSTAFYVLTAELAGRTCLMSADPTPSGPRVFYLEDLGLSLNADGSLQGRVPSFCCFCISQQDSIHFSFSRRDDDAIYYLVGSYAHIACSSISIWPVEPGTVEKFSDIDYPYTKDFTLEFNEDSTAFYIPLRAADEGIAPRYIAPYNRSGKECFWAVTEGARKYITPRKVIPSEDIPVLTPITSIEDITEGEYIIAHEYSSSSLSSVGAITYQADTKYPHPTPLSDLGIIDLGGGRILLTEGYEDAVWTATLSSSKVGYLRFASKTVPSGAICLNQGGTNLYTEPFTTAAARGNHTTEFLPLEVGGKIFFGAPRIVSGEVQEGEYRYIGPYANSGTLEYRSILTGHMDPITPRLYRVSEAGAPIHTSSLKLPSVLSSYMVLQRNADNAIWGKGKAGEEVVVSVSWREEKYRTTVTADGSWKVTVQTGEAATEQTITVASGEDSVTLSHISIGEVWLCSGQSNMQLSVSQTVDVKAKYGSSPNNKVFLFNTGRISSETPQWSVSSGAWTASTSATVGAFSAVAYAFGDELQRALDVPVGLYLSSYGGTCIESWIPEGYLEQQWIDDLAAYRKSANIEELRHHPSANYNAGIAPYSEATIVGVIWYQGCQNRKYSPTYYKDMQQRMITAYREVFRKSDLPFYLVEIAPHTYSCDTGALLREAQRLSPVGFEHVYYVGTNDGRSEFGNIHPVHKLKVAGRLASCALADKYARTVDYLMPEIASVVYRQGGATVSFKNIPGGLVCGDSYVKGFQLLGSDGKLHMAKGTISGASVLLSCGALEGEVPCGLRYLYGEEVGNLFCANGNPVSGFRTDSDNTLYSRFPLYEELVAPTKIKVTGESLKKTTVSDNMTLWSDLSWSAMSMPEALIGYDALLPAKASGGKKTVEIEALSDGIVYLGARGLAYLTALDGLTPIDTGVLGYTGGGTIYVAYKRMKAGETLTIPSTTGNTYSYQIIAKEIEY